MEEKHAAGTKSQICTTCSTLHTSYGPLILSNNSWMYSPGLVCKCTQNFCQPGAFILILSQCRNCSYQVWSLTHFFLFPFCKKIIDLPRGQINDHSSGKHFFLLILPVNSSSPSNALLVSGNATSYIIPLKAHPPPSPLSLRPCPVCIAFPVPTAPAAAIATLATEL